MKSIDKILLHLSLIEGVGPRLVQKVLSQFTDNSIDELYSFSVSDLIHQCAVSQKVAQLLYDGLHDKKILDEELQALEKYNISVLTINNVAYPQQLKQIHLAPTILYVQGERWLSHDCLAIVGSRKAHQYAQDVISMLVPSLIAHNWAIVSGGAIGADTLAHKAALQAQGKTIAVLGSGLLKPHPSSNRRLFNEIIETGGALISPFPLHMSGLPGNFPARNRIIAGLSRGCLVVQAAERSGASITAHYALDQGKDVFAIPGRVDDPLSVGCHRLIQEGAKLVTHVNDILIEFGQTVQTMTLFETTPTFQEPQEIEPNLPLVQKILISCQKPKSMDELIQETGENLDHIQSLLFDLQLQNKISQDFSGLWVAQR